MNKQQQTFSIGLAPLAAIAMTALTAVIAPGPAQADPALPYGPDTCVSGLVWREARPGDVICVRPEDRARTAQENAIAGTRVDPNGAYGPQTCISGFVWREAFVGDTVCVTPDTRRENLSWNSYDRGSVLGAQRHAGYGLPFPPLPNDLG